MVCTKPLLMEIVIHHMLESGQRYGFLYFALILFSIFSLQAACKWDYTNDGAKWNTDCTDTAPVGCNHNKQSPIDILETAPTYNDTAFTGGDHIQLGPDYYDVIEGEFQRKGFTIQFTKNGTLNFVKIHLLQQ